MRIQRIVTGIIGTNMYLVINEDTKHAVIIDPADCKKKVLDYIEQEGLCIDAVLLTHAHFDHIMGIDGFLQVKEVPVYIEKDDLPVMSDIRLNQSAVYTNGYTFDKAKTVTDGQVLELAGFEFRVIHTPGHTMGGCCYYVESESVLFSGDTLFCHSVGRTDFENSSTSSLIRAIREKLMVLPEDTVVYPGHMDLTTIGDEKRFNPFIQ